MIISYQSLEMKLRETLRIAIEDLAESALSLNKAAWLDPEEGMKAMAWKSMMILI